MSKTIIDPVRAAALALLNSIETINPKFPIAPGRQIELQEQRTKLREVLEATAVSPDLRAIFKS